MFFLNQRGVFLVFLWVVFSLVVSTKEINCLERLVVSELRMGTGRHSKSRKADDMI